MRNTMFFILTMYAAVALAQWGNSATESLWVNTADEYYYSFDVQQAHNGNTWFYMDYAPDAHCVQLYDSTGVALLGDKWMLVSNYPDRITGYVNNNLFVDREGKHPTKHTLKSIKSQYYSKHTDKFEQLLK